MIKDNRKTKENSKNQEQYINYIKEYFAEAPIEITNDKTKIYITHNEYPIYLENTSIIEKFTNKNKGIEFTKEQAIKEAEILRNELAIEVKNYKAVEVDLMQNLIKQYFNQFFTYKDCDRDYKIIFDSNYPYTFDLQYEGRKFDFDFEDIISEFLADKRLIDMSFTDVSEFSKAITVGKIEEVGIYSSFVYQLLDTVVSYNFEDYYITLNEDDNGVYFYLDDDAIICSDGDIMFAEVSRYDTNNAYDDFVEIVDYVLYEIDSFLSRISDEYEEQKECAEYAEENYEKDVEQLINKLESEIKIKYPDFEIDDKYIYATDFDNSDFSCEINLYGYNFELSNYEYNAFEQSGFMSEEDYNKFDPNEENYCYQIPYVNKFDYEAFLEAVEEKLNEIKEEILKELN